MEYKISVVMPALNEENNIERAIENVVRGFKTVNVTGEIVVVNDGSTDATSLRVQELQKRYDFLRIVHHDTPQGIGVSFWHGVKEAKGDIVTLLPGDAENDAYEIFRYIPLMEQVDIVIPFVFNKHSRTLQRRIVSSLYRRLINMTFHRSLNYMNGTVMYRRKILQNFTLKSPGFFFQTEILLKCLRVGYLYAEVPCGLRVRGDGVSKALSMKSLVRVSKDFTRTFLSIRVLKDFDFTVHPESVSAVRYENFKNDIPLLSGLQVPQPV